MEEGETRDKKETTDAFEKIQKILDQVKELQRIETEKREAKKQQNLALQNAEHKHDMAIAS